MYISPATIESFDQKLRSVPVIGTAANAAADIFLEEDVRASAHVAAMSVYEVTQTCIEAQNGLTMAKLLGRHSAEYEASNSEYKTCHRTCLGILVNLIVGGRGLEQLECRFQTGPWQ